jgi:hypothetical protein
MKLNLRLAVVAGIIWGVVAIVVGLAAKFLGPLVPSMPGGPTLPTFAVMFAGIHYAARDKKGLLSTLIGGILAGIVAGLFLLVLSLIGTGVPAMGDIVSVLITGVVAGAAGALGMQVVERVKL